MEAATPPDEQTQLVPVQPSSNGAGGPVTAGSRRPK